MKCWRCGNELTTGDAPNSAQCRRGKGCNMLLEEELNILGKVNELMRRDERIPDGAQIRECYETEHEIVVLGKPSTDDKSHSCDEMGCSTVSHVLYRFPKAPASAGKER